jgi:hypothetical protein
VVEIVEGGRMIHAKILRRGARIFKRRASRAATLYCRRPMPAAHPEAPA